MQDTKGPPKHQGHQRQIRLTKASIERAMPARNGGRLDYTISRHPGLILRVSRGWGQVCRTWLFRLPKEGAKREGKAKRGGKTIGVYPGSRNPRGLPELDAAQAAGAWLQERARALDDKSLDEEIEAARRRLEELLERKGQHVTLRDLFIGYQRSQTTTLERTKTLARRSLEKHLPPSWWKEPASARQRLELAQLAGKIALEFPSAAARMLAELAAAYRWGLDQGLVHGKSPAEGIRGPAKSRKRKRFLSVRELPVVWKGLERLSATAADACRLLLLTGQRREAVVGAEWREFDLEAGWWEIPPARLKGREEQDRSHRVRLGELGVSILRARLPNRPRRYVFRSSFARRRDEHINLNTFSNRVSRLSEALVAEGLITQPFQAHDFRRTLATLLVQECEVDPVVIQWILNHEVRMEGALGHYVIPRLHRQAEAAWLLWDRWLLERIGSPAT